MYPVRDEDGSWLVPITLESYPDFQSALDACRISLLVQDVDQLDDPTYWQRDFGNRSIAEAVEGAVGFGLPEVVIGEILAQALRRLSAKARVLDIGCGLGALPTAISQLGFRACGVDFSMSGLGYGRAAQLKWNRHAPLLQADFFRLPFSSESFQLVTACQVFHLFGFERALEVVHEAKRVLCPGGLLYVTVNSISTPLRPKQNPIVLRQSWGQIRIPQDGPRKGVRLYSWSQPGVEEFASRLGLQLQSKQEIRDLYQPPESATIRWHIVFKK